MYKLLVTNTVLEDSCKCDKFFNFQISASNLFVFQNVRNHQLLFYSTHPQHIHPIIEISIMGSHSIAHRDMDYISEPIFVN